MKKLFFITMVSLISICAMAIENSGTTKADAIEFDWNKGVTHPGGTLWYRVDLAPLYEEENPSLTLYLTNPSNVVGSTVDVSMKATVAGQEESKDYTIAARQYKTYTANAKALITLHQTEIYLTLTSNGVLKLSAKVFESEDLDETCKDARTLKWGETAVQNPMYSAWWKVSLKPIKDANNLDAQVTLTNTGSKTVNLKMGQSLDCPSSGMTKREYTLAAGESIVKKIPRDMITSVQPDELYFGVENVESQVSILVETVAQPPVPVIPSATVMPGVNLHVTDTIEPMDEGTTLYKISVADMDSILKYEPEFTYRNVGNTPAKVTVKMAFSRPAFGTSDTEYDLEPGAEEIVVYKKNMLEGMDQVDSIYLLTTVTGTVNFYGRFKHIREGKACKTNIDFNWETGHMQEARTTQWYAIDVTYAKTEMQDIIVYLYNTSNSAATIKASMAFSCPYIDLTEMSRTIGKNDTVSRRLGFSSYAMMSDTIWIGLETNQEIRLWATTEDAKAKEEVDCACQKADTLDWKEGAVQEANDTVWYLIDMTEVRNLSAKFPTIFVQNLSSTAAAHITAEMSLECPDSLENQKQTLTIAANDSYSRKMARNMFENIKDSVIYLRVISTQKISLQIRLNEEAEGTSCASAIPFNWTSGNSQAANSNLWYQVDLRKPMKDSLDLYLTIENKDAAACEGVGQLTFGCPDDEAPSVQSFTLASKGKKTIFRPHSATQLLPDSVIYINLQGNTAMRISAEMVTPAPFKPITGAGLALDTLLLDAKVTTVQSSATQWYLVPQEEVQHMRDTIKQIPLTPNIQIENIGTEDYDVTIEVAFQFPIIETMMSQKVTVKAGQRYAHALDYKLFKQAMTKFDSVLVRVTLPEGGVGKIRFRSGLDKAFNGNTRETASPIVIGEEYVQDGNTTMWYKLKTADWKKDKSLINKRINVRTSNKGNAATTIKVAVYEGLQAKVDMFEQFALENYRERTIKKGEDRNRDFPAQNILLVGDVELYIQVTTTEKITFRTKIDGEYAKIADDDIDATQFEAKLLAPNVDYEVPGDNKYHWYQICIPYIRDNHKYSHESSLTYELNDQATIEVLNTFMDTMRYNFPSRKRTVNKAKKHYVDTTLLSDLLSKGLARVTEQKFDITTFDENFVDSMLHRYVTSDSITLYIRYKTDADMTVRLNMPQVKGLDCNTSVKFDWEHGFVNPTEQTNYIHVQMDSTRVPEGKDLMIHMDRWAEVPTNVKADFFAEDCQGDPLGSLNKTIDKDTFRILKREFLQNIGWSGLMIQYYSDTTTHIWAELIESVIPDTVYDTIPMWVCKGYSFIDVADTARTIYSDTIFNVYRDSINKEEAKYYICETHYDVKLLQDPTLPDIKSLSNKPVIAIGSALDVTATTAEINSYIKGSTDSTYAAVDTITWEYSWNGTLFNALPDPAPMVYKTSIALRYTVVTECGSEIQSAIYKNAGYATVEIDTCGPIDWLDNHYDQIGKSTIKDTIPATGTAALDSIVTLNLTITPDTADTDDVTVCEFPYTWNNRAYDAPGVYDTTILGSTCYTYYTLDLKEITPIFKKDTFVACNEYTLNGITYKDSAIVNDTIRTDYGCDSIITTHHIHITIPTIDTLSIISKYGDRLLMINRNEINLMDGWDLDIIEDQNQVKWYRIEANGDTTYLTTGYYLTNPDGSQNGPVIQPGRTYYAVMEQPAETAGECPRKAETKPYTIGKAAAAPALVPSLARPGEDVRVINLNPEETTTIRVYTSEGMIQSTYTVRGEESFTIQAAKEHGFYLVELRAESIKSTLRYIVK